MHEAITNEGVHPAPILGGKSAQVVGECIKAPEFVPGDREALDGCWKRRGPLGIAEARHRSASVAVDLQVQGLGTLEVDRGRIDARIEQDVERLAIHSGVDADLGLRKVKRDAKCLPENRTPPEPEKNHQDDHSNTFHIRVSSDPENTAYRRDCDRS